MSFFTERELGRAFKLELENKKFCIRDKQGTPYTTSFKVYLNKPVQTKKGKFIKFWKTKKLDINDIPPSQPEIDMILIDELGIWRAIELKAIKKTEKKTKKGTRKELSSPYYVGLGQTFAYLSYGIDEVALWQCFDGNSMTDNEIYEYNDTLGKIREPIKCFVDATYFKILNEGQKPRIQTSVYYKKDEREWREWKDGVGIYRQETGMYHWECHSSNPFLIPFQTSEGYFTFNQDIVTRVKVVREFLEKQKTEVWDKKK